MFVLVLLLLLSVENGNVAEVATCEQMDLRSLLGLVKTFGIETKDKLFHLKETVTSANLRVSKDLEETNRRIDTVNATLNFVKNALVNIRHILEIDECHSNPCKNGAICADGINSYSCRCIAGYNGTNCQININECASAPCQNNATCHDQINGYKCTCLNGWTGAYCQKAFHQSGYYGTNFITGFMEGHGDPTLLIACPERTALINVSIPALGIFNEQHQLTNGALTLTYSDDISSAVSGKISNKGVYITADRPVALFAGRLTYDSSVDGSLVMPDISLGSDYILSGFPFGGIGTEEYLIAGTVDQTIIKIFKNSVTENITLNRMETYMRVGTHLTGTMISSSAPVYVISGHRCANIPNITVGGCDYIDEEMPPLSSLGTRHVVSYMAPRPDFTISIAFPYNNTAITIYNATGIEVETITSMMKTTAIFRSFPGFQSISIISTQPVLVTQYGHGQGSSNIKGDPSMMTIPDVSHFGNRYDFVVPQNFTSSVAVVMNSSYSITDLLLDSVAFTPTKTINVTITGYGMYVVLYGDVLPGYHRLVHTAGNSVSFGAWIYGRREAAEYAWSLGHT